MGKYMIKVLVQEERRRDDLEDPSTYWQTTDEITSERPEVIAAFLKALAERLHPTPKVTR